MRITGTHIDSDDGGGHAFIVIYEPATSLTQFHFGTSRDPSPIGVHWVAIGY